MLITNDVHLVEHVYTKMCERSSHAVYVVDDVQARMSTLLLDGTELNQEVSVIVFSLYDGTAVLT